MSTSPLSLEPINIETYYNFAEHHFQADGKHITREAFNTIYNQFEGITWYVQFVLNMAYGMISNGTPCDEALTSDAIRQVIKTFSTVFENMLYQLPFKQKEVLIAIAREGKAENVTAKPFLRKYALTASSVQAAIKGLLEKDFITHHLGIYQISDKFFALWLLERDM